MSYKKTDEIFVRTLHVGYIPHLKTSGPIVNFIKVDIATCHSMLLSGIELYQLDPETKMTMQLTLTNLYDDKKFNKVEKAVAKKLEKENKKVTTDISLDGVDANAVPPATTQPAETDGSLKEGEDGVDGTGSEAKDETSDPVNDENGSSETPDIMNPPVENSEVKTEDSKKEETKQTNTSNKNKGGKTSSK